MKIKYYFYRTIDKILSPIPEKIIRSTIRWVKKRLEPYKKEIFNKEMARRAKYPLNNFLAIAKDIAELVTNEVYVHNDFYYNARTLKKFAGLDETDYIKAAMEHAPYLTDNYWECDIDSPFNSIIVNSNYRKDVISKVSDKNVIVVGPYIAYAENILSKEQIEKEKKRLGKNLLVFPMHSTHWIDVDYNIANFIEKIKHLGKDFDSIRICMYWKDILRGSYKPYKKAGFEIVCAGHLYEPNFIPRLKSIIEISDFTMSNQAGSQVGFCIYLNKPHYLIEDDFERNCKLEELIAHTEEGAKKVRESGVFTAVYDVFSTFSDTITEEQKNVVDKYWGVSEVKTKEELKKILLSLGD